MSIGVQSHEAIRNQELYDLRDAFGRWHRHNLPSECTAIDIDLLGYCRTCREGLYLIESTTNPDKYHTVLQRHAARAETPGFVVVLDSFVDPETFKVKRVWPTPILWLFQNQWIDGHRLAAWLLAIRAAHQCQRSVS